VSSVVVVVVPEELELSFLEHGDDSETKK